MFYTFFSCSFIILDVSCKMVTNEGFKVHLERELKKLDFNVKSCLPLAWLL